MVPSVYVKLRDIKNRSGWLLLSFTLYFCMNGLAKQFVFPLTSFLREFRWARIPDNGQFGVSLRAY